MTRKMNLLPCPFCGGDAKLYASKHDDGVICAAVYCGQSIACPGNLGFASPKTIDDAIATWNRRTPEPGTSVVRWVRYDGTEETLPKEHNPVRLSRGEYEIVSLFEGMWVDTTDSFAGHPQIGEMWCYLPEPPEETI